MQIKDMCDRSAFFFLFINSNSGSATVASDIAEEKKLPTFFLFI
jgi:hypothetical protein